MEIELKPATYRERTLYYKEEWDVNDIPDFILNSLYSREFGFDHIGQGPNDRYKTFTDPLRLKRFMKAKKPFAAYTSVAYYDKPEKRHGWEKAEFVFDVDAKDIPIRTCECKPSEVCDKCLKQAKEIVLKIGDILKSDIGFKNLNYVYSGRGYHLRVLDEHAMDMDSEMRGEIIQYVLGGKVPDMEDAKKLGYNKFNSYTLSFAYYQNFKNWMNYTIQHLKKDTPVDIDAKLLKDTIKYRDELPDHWGFFNQDIGPIRYKKLQEQIARTNLAIADTKVSIDLKRILRLPSTLHSKVSMKSMLIKDIETFDPFDKAVPKFVYERKE